VLLLPVLLVAAAVLLGLVLVLRPALMTARHIEADPVFPRISAELHSGEEQVMIQVARSLSVAMGPEQTGYGEIYVASSAENVIKLASRSEIGRGFDGEIRLQRGRRGTLAEYFVLRLPGDETLHPRVLRLDGQIADALRRIDPQAEVRVSSEHPPRSRGRVAAPVPGAGRPGQPPSYRSSSSMRRSPGVRPSDSFR
jgi:hypothetical protein